MVRSVTEREPLWTSEDRAYLLAYIAERDEVCTGCGNPLDECRDPATMRTWRVESETCQACLVGEAEADNRAELERQTKRRQHGLYYGVVRSR